MLSGQYDVLVDNLWLADILSVILLIIPFFLLFMNGKWIFFYYTISVVANLPLIFSLTFNFSYEAVIGLTILITIIKEIVREKRFRYLTTKENLLLILMLSVLLVLNLLTSIFHFNANEFLIRLYIYLVNMFILGVFTYYFKNTYNLRFIKNGFIIGAIILVVSMLVELVYGHYYLDVRNMRPAGLLLDPNVCAFALNLALVISFMDRRADNFIFNLFIVFSRVIILFGIFLTVSRSAYISTIFILIFLSVYYSKGKRRWMVPSVVIVFIVMYFIFNKVVLDFIDNIYKIIDLGRIFPRVDYVPSPLGGNDGGSGGVNYDYSNSRLLLIKSAFFVFSNNFIIGVGIGNVSKEIGIISGLEMNAHNLYLQLLAESGIIMLFALLFFVYYLAVYIYKLDKKYKYLIILIFSVIFIESMFNHNLLNINIIYLVLAFILGLAMLSSKDKRVYILNKENLKLKKSKYD